MPKRKLEYQAVCRQLPRQREKLLAILLHGTLMQIAFHDAFGICCYE
jgi:hypothetical protein